MVIFKRKKMVTKNNQQEEMEMYTENARFINVQTDSIEKEQLKNNYQELIKKNELLINKYYRCRIYSKIASKDNKFNLQMITLDKHINRLNKEIKAFDKDIKFLEHGENPDGFEDKITEKYLNIENFYQTINNNVDGLMKKYFSHMKIATANISMNRSNQELENIYCNLNQFLQDYSNLNEAAEYIFFNSSQLILKTIDSLIKAIPNNEFNFNYFLKSDDIITLELKEWIDLYNKIRFVIKKADTIIDNIEFKENYITFEMSYLILMMNMEASKNQIKNYRI